MARGSLKRMLYRQVWSWKDGVIKGGLVSVPCCSPVMMCHVVDLCRVFLGQSPELIK